MKASFTATAEAYARDVVAGRIPAGRYIRLACQRHLDDLDWQDDEEFKFRFDPKRGARVCAFIELLPQTKGKWAAKRERLKLEPWQVFFIMCAFGWLRKKDGLRRYRKILLLVPRKNGKSALAAGIGLYMLCADGEHGAEVYSGATTEKQAWEVFRPAKLMAQKSPQLLSEFGLTPNAKNLHILANGSRFEPVIGTPGDGASPSCAIVDEYHEHQTDALYSTMETGMGAREQPIMLVITTAGENIAGPCHDMQMEAQASLEGARRDDELFALIYGIDDGDDWTDPAVLRKANPNFGISVFEDFLHARQIEAMASPRKAAAFKTKHLNQWVTAKAAYFNVLRYQAAGDGNLTLDQFENQECIIGIDLAEKTDLTSVELLFPYRNGFARFGFYYLPQETIDRPENDLWQKWREMGLITETDGAVTDDREILEDIMELCERFKVREVAFDPLHSRQMAIWLAERDVTCIDFANRPTLMNEPMRKMDALILSGELHHGVKKDDQDPFAWMLGNVVNRSETSDIHSPKKQKPQNKIDGPVACMMALGRWLLDEEPGGQMDDFLSSPVMNFG